MSMVKITIYYSKIIIYYLHCACLRKSFIRLNFRKGKAGERYVKKWIIAQFFPNFHTKKKKIFAEGKKLSSNAVHLKKSMV
jgi:hypothetical protein